MAFRFQNWMLLTICATLVLGCSKGPGVQTYPVSGTVKYKGAPVAGVQVAFTSPSQAKPAVGTTDAQGKFQLTTFAPNDGAPAGSYTVTVAKPKASSSGNTEMTVKTASGGIQPSDDYAKFMKGAAKKSAAKAESVEEGGVPEKYASPGSSDLKAEVTKGGPNDKFDFDLK
jgi:hypothetical protein